MRIRTVQKSVRRPSMIGESVRRESGFSHSGIPFVVAFLLLLCGGVYIYSVNASAVQGYRIRHLEQEIAALREDNARLKILEAETRSFERIENASVALSLEKTKDVSYYDEYETVAFR